MMIGDFELTAEVRACASLITVLRSIDDALLESVQVTVVPVGSFAQVSVPAAMAPEAPRHTTDTARVNAASSLSIMPGA
jgi:hypothetical protein